MALARIISHSLECSQTLAASLEERGYAVEIVSPDAIPAYPADLELRVETSPDNVLTARVQAHNGLRSASLDFVHYLNPPIPDFRRPEALELPSIAPPAIAVSPQPVAIERAHADQPEQLPEPARPVPEASVVLAETMPALPPSVALNPEPRAVERAQTNRPEQAPERARSWPKVKIVIYRANPILKPNSAPMSEPKRIRRPAGWFLRVAATAGTLLLAAALLSLGTLPRRDTSAVSNGQNPSLAAQPPAAHAQADQMRADQQQTDQVRTDDDSSLSAHLNMSAGSPSAAPAIDHSIVSGIEADKLKGKKSPSTASKIYAASSVKRATSRPLHHRSRTHRADVVAPNTITYFNSPGAKPTVVKPLPRHPVRSQKHDRAVAARSMAALNATAEPKAGSDK